jgi:hypothetical protein
MTWNPGAARASDSSAPAPRRPPAHRREQGRCGLTGARAEAPPATEAGLALLAAPARVEGLFAR